MGKNGLSLKRPEKETQKVNIALPRRGRPPGKGNSPKNSSKKLIAKMKGKKAKIVIPIIDIVEVPSDSDDDDIDDEDDKSFRPNMGKKKKVSNTSTSGPTRKR